MKKKSLNKIPGVVLSLFIMFLMEGCTPYVRPTMPGGKAPVITSSYSIERGRYGDVLKFYIEADDQDNDMFKIATVVEQTGYGRYPTDWIFLKPQYTGHFAGYLKWNTYSQNTSYLAEWTWITIKVAVIDKTGRQSNVVVFPFEFASEVIQNPPPPAPFDQANVPMLGNITIDLYEPTRMGGGFWWRD